MKYRVPLRLEFDGYAERLDSESIEEFTDDDINELLKE